MKIKHLSTRIKIETRLLIKKNNWNTFVNLENQLMEDKKKYSGSFNICYFSKTLSEIAWLGFDERFYSDSRCLQDYESTAFKKSYLWHMATIP